jgi:hypothetical protein
MMNRSRHTQLAYLQIAGMLYVGIASAIAATEVITVIHPLIP